MCCILCLSTYQMACLGLLAIAQACSANDSGRSRIAVVGAGLGGSFSAYSLRELSIDQPGDNDMDIDVFEASSISGGRARSFHFHDEALELGGSIIWDRNQYIIGAAEKLGVGLTKLSKKKERKEAKRNEGTTAAPTVPDGFAVYDGVDFVLNQTGSWLAMAKMALKYGPSPLLYGRHAMKVWAEHFRFIYDLQGPQEGRVFDDPGDMLVAMGLFNLTQQSCEEHLKEFLGQYWWSWGAKHFANDLAGPINRCNYNQANAQMNAFAGLVSYLPAAGGDLYAIKGGNARLAEAMLEAANVSLHLNQPVTHIQLDVAGTYTLTTNAAAGKDSSQEVDANAGSYDSSSNLGATTHGPYDAVIIATPLEAGHFTFGWDQAGDHVDSQFGGDDSSSSSSSSGGGGLGSSMGSSRSSMQHIESDCSSTGGSGSSSSSVHRRPWEQVCCWMSCRGKGRAGQNRTFQQTVTTYVAGELQPSFFGVRSLPSLRVFVADNADLPFSAISPKVVDGSIIYKIFSKEPIPSTLLSSLFGSAAEVLSSHVWAAYPAFQPPEVFAPFRLAPGLCYINTIENAASAFEMSAIGARNCALMAREHTRRVCQAEPSAA